MDIWKELTNPDSFAGQYETAVEALAPMERPERSNGPSEHIDKKESRIGPGIVIEGTVEGNGDIRIAGSIKGDVRLKGNLSIESGGRIVGAVSADSVTLGGDVEGNINASNHVTLLETAQLVGDLKARFLTVAAGSRMRGRVEFGWDQPEAFSIGLRTVSQGPNDIATQSPRREREATRSLAR